MEPLNFLIGALGPTGLMAWWVFHTTKYTIPEIIKGHKEEMANQAEAHTKAIVKMAEDHKAEIRQLVELFRQDISEGRDFRRQEMQEVLKRVAVACPLHGKQDGD